MGGIISPSSDGAAAADGNLGFRTGSLAYRLFPVAD